MVRLSTSRRHGHRLRHGLGLARHAMVATMALSTIIVLTATRTVELLLVLVARIVILMRCLHLLAVVGVVALTIAHHLKWR